MGDRELAVVVAEAPGSPSIEGALRAIRIACEGLAVEIVVVGSTGGSEHPALTHVACAPGTLVPIQWGLGFAASRAPLVAFLTTELIVDPAWARALIPLLIDTVAGVAGAIDVQPPIGATASAIHFARFSAFLPSPGQSPRPVADIPGDGAIYRRAAITTHPDLLRLGFWEVEFHRRFRGDGLSLVQSREPLVHLTPTASLGRTAGFRFRHGYGHGATRVLEHHENRVRIAALAPLVPLVLISRIARRAGWTRLGPLARALVPLSLLTAAWACGEALGAVTARGRPDDT